ncbi:MAG: TIM barrel protein [Bryobacteraceae bacterium]|jgi:sugar phosphate isomerase/epimerase
MTRRELIAAGALCATRAWARTHIDKFSISAITDEIGRSTDDSIAFAHQYGLKFVEIRNHPGSRKEYFLLTEPEIKVDAVRFANEGLKVSFVNTSLLKFAWPGMEPARKTPEEPDARQKRLALEKARWDSRMEDLSKAMRCAQIMGCDKVRVFTGSRVADPASQFQRIADNIGEMSLTAEREKVYLPIENEMSQNVATAAELAAVLNLIPSKWVGCNWNPHNAYGREAAFPDGYNSLPKRRLLNIHIQAKGVTPESPEKEEWKAIFEALERDSYKHKIGLETHIFDSAPIAAAHASMDEILHIVNQL